MTNAEKIKLLEEVVRLMTRAAEIVREIDPEHIEEYRLTEFEGGSGGWLGGRIDHVERLYEKLMANR